MKTYAGNQRVERGYYLDRKSFKFAHVTQDGGQLPGGAETRFVQLPVAVVVAAAPVLGGLFVVALPFIGFGLTAYAIGRALSGGARVGAREIAATVAPPLVPGQAHLAGKPGEEGAEKAGAEAAKDARIDELEREIAGKREDGGKES